MIDGIALGPLRAAEFVKYHALGNDYLLIDDAQFALPITPQSMAALCHRHTGVGSDGVLVRGDSGGDCHASLRIYNPDGSLAEKSGNGLRIFARALYDLGYLQDADVRVSLGQQVVHLQLKFAPIGGLPQQAPAARAQVALIRADMGVPVLNSTSVGMTGPARPTIHETLDVLGTPLDVCAVSMGNPHCVHFVAALEVAQLRRLGPAIERHPVFSQRTNVQLAQVVDRGNLNLLIWERGAKETAASGSSSCAAVAAAQARGLCDDTVRVHSPGGTLLVQRGPGGTLMLTGPAEPISRGFVSASVLQPAGLPA